MSSSATLIERCLITPWIYIGMTIALIIATLVGILLYRLSLRWWVRAFREPGNLRLLLSSSVLTVWGLLAISLWFTPGSRSFCWDMLLPRDPIFRVPFVFWIVAFVWLVVFVIVFIHCWKSRELAR